MRDRTCCVLTVVRLRYKPCCAFKRRLKLQMPSLASLLGPKRMLLDQAIVNDSVETSVFKRHSRRRSVAAWLPHQQAQGIMAYYGWNETEYGSVGPGPPWSNDEAGLVWSTLSYPEQAHAETVRLSL